jgi:cation:H+ antiporter
MLLAGLSTFFLIFVFLSASAIIWVAGLQLAYATDFIANRLNLGEAFGGLVMLAIVTNLPEIAITTVAAYHHETEIAVSNILGGIAIQTVVLVLIDVFGVGKKFPLMLKSRSYVLLIEGVTLIFILTLVMIGKQFSTNLALFHSSPFEWLLLGVWLGGLYLVSVYSKENPQTQPHPRKFAIQRENIQTIQQKKAKPRFAGMRSAVFMFTLCAIATLFAGWILEESGSQLADRFHLSGVLFGATFLALSTSLPEISTGIASAKIQDYQMAVSDIFGGNAFLPVLLLLASLITGSPILPVLHTSDMYLTGIGILLTGVYMIGMMIPNKKQIGRMGIDSLVVLIVYLISLAGLVLLS